MLTYHYVVTPDDNETLLITFPDVPEAAAVAESHADLAKQAVEGLEAALQMYVDARRPLPPAVFTDGPGVSLGASASVKLLIANEMAMQGVRKADLARSMGVHPPQIDRLLDLGHSTKIEALEDALRALGKRLSVCLVD